MNCFICYANVELKKDGTYKCEECDFSEFIGLTSEHRNLFNKDNKFDIDLAYGEIKEKELYRILKKEKIEVKAEREKWKKTGNIAIEIRGRDGRLSGISITEATTWIHLLSINGSIEGGFIFKVSDLKERIKQLHESGDAKLTKGGDDNATQMVLLPISKLFKN